MKRVNVGRVRADIEALEERSMFSSTLRAHFLGSVYHWERDTLFEGEHTSLTYVDRVKPTLAMVNGQSCAVENRVYDDGGTSSLAVHVDVLGQYNVRSTFYGADGFSSRFSFTPLRQIAAGHVLNQWYQNTQPVTEVLHFPDTDFNVTLAGSATTKSKLVGEQMISVPAGAFQAKYGIVQSGYDVSGAVTTHGTTYHFHIVSDGRAQIWSAKDVGVVQRQTDETDRLTINGKTTVSHRVVHEKLDGYTPGE